LPAILSPVQHAQAPLRTHRPHVGKSIAAHETQRTG
jgi:hypothetical protein